MEEVKAPMYAYVKGSRYDSYRIVRDEDEDLKEINQEFDTFEEMIEWAYQFSDLNSIPVQFYI